MEPWEQESVSLEAMRAASLIRPDGCWRVHVESRPDSVFVALFDLDSPHRGGQQVWYTTVSRPPGKTSRATLLAALRVLVAHLAQEAG